jgi:hypothetical protein
MYTAQFVNVQRVHDLQQIGWLKLDSNHMVDSDDPTSADMKYFAAVKTTNQYSCLGEVKER